MLKNTHKKQKLPYVKNKRKNSSMMLDLDVVKRLATDRQSVPFPETQGAEYYYCTVVR